MPLPRNGTSWPPAALAPITPALTEWDAWYVGTPAALRAVYGAGQGATVVETRTSQRRGGVVGALARFWWGRPVSPSSAQERVDQLHIPIASDIAQASADLIYSEAPVLEVTSDTLGVRLVTDDDGVTTSEPHADLAALQARLDGYLDDGLVSTLAGGAEVGAALGGRFHRVTWGQDGRVFLATVDADAALPEFTWGALTAVTFWHVLTSDTAGVVLRHLERHELDSEGRGVVLHGLYSGTATSLGRAIPLADHPATAGLIVYEDGAVVAERTPGLLVEYVANQTPNRRWRKDALGRNLGRSDFDGVEPLMDALDEAYSSWMRDIRNGKGRIIASEVMLEDNGAGKGATFDMDRGVFVGLPGLLPSRNDTGGLPIQVVQFAIRVDEHQRTCQQLVEDILRSAGYSAQTFGEGPDSAAMTATEVQSRERRSYLTRSRKLRHEAPALRRLLVKMLRTDAAINGTTPVPDDVSVSVVFGDSAQDSPLGLAQTAQALRVARSASTKTLVRMQHPDWTDDQVEEEVVLIEAADSLADPFAAVPLGAETPAADGDVKDQADAMGVLIRAGVAPDDAATRTGLDGVRFTGAVPTSLRLPEADASDLEQV